MIYLIIVKCRKRKEKKSSKQTILYNFIQTVLKNIIYELTK